MSFLDYLLGRRQRTAEVARERLQIILAHERSSRNAPEYLPALQRDILEVVLRYIHISPAEIRVNVEREGEYEVLELNIPLPDEPNHRIGAIRANAVISPR